MNIIKSFLLVGLLCVTTVFANVNDAKDTKENKEILNTLYEKVIIKDVNWALVDIKSLKDAVLKKDIKKSKEDFSKLVNSWKSVETFYLLGDINEDFIDTPRYIDIFHNGNENIKEQLDRAIKSKDEIRIVLFKNSLKSINALEYDIEHAAFCVITSICCFILSMVRPPSDKAVSKKSLSYKSIALDVKVFLKDEIERKTKFWEIFCGNSLETKSRTLSASSQILSCIMLLKQMSSSAVVLVVRSIKKIINIILITYFHFIVVSLLHISYYKWS